MMDLVHSHNYVKLWELQKKKEWKQSVGMQVSDRVGKRVGILGYGSIGRQGKHTTFSTLFSVVGILRTSYFDALRLSSTPQAFDVRLCIFNLYYLDPTIA